MSFNCRVVCDSKDDFLSGRNRQSGGYSGSSTDVLGDSERLISDSSVLDAFSSRAARSSLTNWLSYPPSSDASSLDVASSCKRSKVRYSQN